MPRNAHEWLGLSGVNVRAGGVVGVNGEGSKAEGGDMREVGEAMAGAQCGTSCIRLLHRCLWVLCEIFRRKEKDTHGTNQRDSNFVFIG